MNKQDAMKRIEAIEAEAAALRKMVQEEEKPQGLWKPESGDKYWYVDDYTGISGYTNKGLVCDYRVKQGNCFPTGESAKKAAPLFARAHKIIQAALMADPEAGAMEIKTRKWTAMYDMTTKKWEALDIDWAGNYPAYVHTKAQAEHMAAILNAEGV